MYKAVCVWMYLGKSELNNKFTAKISSRSQ